MKCPRCMTPIGPDDRLCPSCGSVLSLERRPTRPDEEKGWTLRHLASIMGRAGCALLIAENSIVLVGVASFAGTGIAFMNQPTVPPDLAPLSALILAAQVLDLIGLGLVAVALVVLGAGAMLLRRRDPFTDEEVLIPPHTAMLPMAAGLLVFLWALLTAIWRLAYPVAAGSSAAELLAEFAATGPAGEPGYLPTMMAAWIAAVASLFAGSVCLRVFVRRLPAKIYSPRPMKPSSWVDFTGFNLVVTVVVAAFPLGWITYQGFQVVFLTFLATKLLVVPIIGLLAYWTLLTRFEAFGKLALMVPVLRAIPPQPGVEPTPGPHIDPGFAPGYVPQPPGDEDMRGIDRVR